MGSVLRYTPENDPGWVSEAVSSFVHHEVDPDNQINTLFGEVSNGVTDDDASNLEQDDKYYYTYDVFNRLATVRQIVGELLIARFRYDALGRRVLKTDYLHQDDTTFLIPVDYYYYDGDRLVEIHRKVNAGDGTPGDYSLDDCPAPDPPPGGGKGTTEKAAVASGASSTRLAREGSGLTPVKDRAVSDALKRSLNAYEQAIAKGPSSSLKLGSAASASASAPDMSVAV